MAEFAINIPENLSFQDYIHICHVARTWADGYDLKDPTRLEATLAPHLTIDYSGVVPAWGSKPYTRSAFIASWLSPEHLGLPLLSTQHLLSMPYFKSVSEREIIVEWQIIASHGRRVPGVDGEGAMGRVEGTSNHRGFLEHGFVWVGEGEGEREQVGVGRGGEERPNRAEETERENKNGRRKGSWRIQMIRPRVIFQPGDFMHLRRPVEED